MVSADAGPAGGFVDEDFFLDLRTARSVEKAGRKAAVSGGEELEPQVRSAGFAEGAFGPLARPVDGDLLFAVNGEVLARQRAVECPAPAAAHIALANLDLIGRVRQLDAYSITQAVAFDHRISPAGRPVRSWKCE